MQLQYNASSNLSMSGAASSSSLGPVDAVSGDPRGLDLHLRLVDEDEVGVAAGVEAALLVLQAQRLCRVQGGRLQSVNQGAPETRRKEEEIKSFFFLRELWETEFENIYTTPSDQ